MIIMGEFSFPASGRLQIIKLGTKKKIREDSQLSTMYIRY